MVSCLLRIQTSCSMYWIAPPILFTLQFWKVQNETMVWNQPHDIPLILSLRCYSQQFWEQCGKKEIHQGIHELWQLMYDHNNTPTLLKPAGRWLGWVCSPLPWRQAKQSREVTSTVTLPASQASSHTLCWAFIHQKQEVQDGKEVQFEGHIVMWPVLIQ